LKLDFSPLLLAKVFMITANAHVSSFYPPQSVATVSFFSITSPISPNLQQFSNYFQAIFFLLLHVSSSPEYQLHVVLPLPRFESACRLAY
jgi:hypothetical protein